jgi:hypothetical protein
VPTHTRYDHTARLAVLEAHGVITPEEAVAQFRAACTELAELHAREPGREYGVLVDSRLSATVPTRAHILQLLDEICAHRAARPPRKWAVLATEPAHFGMGRLLQAHAEERQIEIQVFKSQDEAIAWLSSAQ